MLDVFDVGPTARRNQISQCQQGQRHLLRYTSGLSVNRDSDFVEHRQCCGDLCCSLTWSRDATSAPDDLLYKRRDRICHGDPKSDPCGSPLTSKTDSGRSPPSRYARTLAAKS